LLANEQRPSRSLRRRDRANSRRGAFARVPSPRYRDDDPDIELGVHRWFGRECRATGDRSLYELRWAVGAGGTILVTRDRGTSWGRSGTLCRVCARYLTLRVYQMIEIPRRFRSREGLSRRLCFAPLSGHILDCSDLFSPQKRRRWFQINLVNFDWLAKPFNLDRTATLSSKRIRQIPPTFRAHEHMPRSAMLLQPRGEIHAPTYRRISKSLSAAKAPA
jgi:hypothetical protein